MRVIATALLALFPVMAHADSTSGTIAAFDRKAAVIVMMDKTIWKLNDKTVIPEGLEAGDKITIEFVSAGDSGAGSVLSLTKLDS